MREALLPARQTAWAWLQPAALFLAAACSNSVYLCFSGITDEVAAWLATSPGAIDALASLGNAATAVGYPLAASVADRAGIGAGFTAGVSVTAVGCGLRALGGAAGSFALLVVGQFVGNLGNCFLNVLPAALAVRRFPAHQQGLATAIGQVGVDLGAFGGPLLGGAFRSRPGRLIWMQFLASLAVLPSALLFLGGARGSGAGVQAGADCPHAAGVCRRSLWFLRLPGAALLCLGATAGITVLNTFPAALEQVVCAVPGLGVNALSGALALSVLLGEAVTGAMADVLSTGPVLCCSALVVCIGWLLCLLGWLWLVPPVAIMVGWVLLATFGMGAMQMLSFLRAAEAAPSSAGTASALLHFATSVACVLVQLLTAVLLNSPTCEIRIVRDIMLGWSVTGWVASALVILAVAVLQGSPLGWRCGHRRASGAVIAAV